MQNIIDFISIQLKLPYWQYILSFIILLSGFVARRLFDIYLMNRFQKIIKNSSSSYVSKYISSITEAIKPPISTIFIVGAFFFAINILPLPEKPVDLRFFFLRHLRFLLL